MSVAPVPVRPALRSLLVSVILFAGTVILFSRSLGVGFSIYDDPGYVTNNPHVQAGFTRTSLAWAFSGQADYWHPLTWLSHMFDWRMYGENAAGHHLTSVLWHAANAVLAFLVMRRLTGAFWTAALAAAMFAWHPLRVESVAWITERKDVMSGCFFLLTLGAYAGYVERRIPGQRAAGRYGLTFALFFAGLMCKPMLVTVPVVLLLLDVWPFRRAEVDRWNPHSWRAPILEKLPFFAVSAAVSIVTVLMQRDDGAFVLQLPLAARLGNAVVSVARYLGKVGWPFDLTVCYPHPGFWPAAIVLGAVVLLAAICGLAWWQRTARPWLLVGWLWFLVMLLPAIGLVQVGFQAMADRYTYAPVLGLHLAVLWSAPAWVGARDSRRWMAAAVASLLLSGWLVRSWNQQATWRSSVALFEHAVAVTKQNEFAHAFLGYTYLSENRAAEALAESRAALELNPRNAMALFTRAAALEKTGAIDDAIAAYRAVLAVDPRDGSARFALGLQLLRRGATDEGVREMKAAAIADPDARNTNLRMAGTAAERANARQAALHFEIATAAEPDDASLHFALGLARARSGFVDAAMEAYRAALERDPNHAEAHTQLGLLLLTKRQAAEAAGHFRAALTIQPKSGDAHLGLGRASSLLGDLNAAAEEFQRAVECAPDNPLACRAWAQTLARRGQFVEASRYYEKATRADPNDAGTFAELGYALWLSGQRDQAATAWRTALRLDPHLPGLRERLENLGIR